MKNVLYCIKEITELEFGGNTYNVCIASQSCLGINEGQVWFALLTSQNSTNDL